MDKSLLYHTLWDKCNLIKIANVYTYILMYLYTYLAEYRNHPIYTEFLVVINKFLEKTSTLNLYSLSIQLDIE